MITIAYSTREANPKFKDYLIKKCGLKNIEVLEYVNNNQFSLSEVYNKALADAKHDIIVFSHDDIQFETDNWGKKILKHFERQSQYAILTIAGTTDLLSGQWWQEQHKMIGIVNHQHEGRKWTSKYSANLGDQIVDVVVGDGLFFAVQKNKLKTGFDEEFNGFHFYDIPFFASNFIQGAKIGNIFDIRVTHLSIGMTNQQWADNKALFEQKYGKNLPLTTAPSSLLIEDDSVKIKKEPRVNIVICHKDKNVLLFKCLQSIFDHVKYKNYRIIIADTGSSRENMHELSMSVGIPYPNKVKIVRYNYYNFAQINNDVVKNHLDEDCELLLFCNNDIEFVNDCLSQMVAEYQQTNNAGCIGARLHYPDNSVQHSGVIAVHNTKSSTVQFGHHGIRSYYNYYPNTVRDILGVTGALLLIKKDVFIKMGMFNEVYSCAFEDVQLNIQCILSGRQNILVGNAVAYHAESQTRNDDPKKNMNEMNDLTNILLPFVGHNFKKLEKYIMKI
jgi:GT2 family glycosyltransferase